MENLLKNTNKKNKTLNQTRQYYLYSMCSIPILLIIVFNYLPMFGIIIAFKNYSFDKGILGSDWVGFKNFEFFIKSKDFLEVTWNTLSLNFLFILFGTIAAVLVALLFFELRSKLATKIFQTIFITPHFLSWVVVGYMAYAVLHPQFGIVNQIIGYFGISPINWYVTPNVWPIILTIASVWKTVGLDSVVYYAALMAIDSSYFEAAEIDGANKWQTTKCIVIPSIVPLITILTILKVGNIFRADFGLFYQLTRDVGQLYKTTDVVDTYLYRTMRVSGDMGMSSAIGVLQSVVGFVLVVCTNYFSKKIDPDNGLF